MKKLTPLFIIVASILTVVLSWAFYRIMYQLFTDLLLHYGIESFYMQNILIAVIALILLLIIGVSVKSVRKKLFKWYN